MPLVLWLTFWHQNMFWSCELLDPNAKYRLLILHIYTAFIECQVYFRRAKPSRNIPYMHSDQSVMIWWATFIFHPIYKGQFGSLVGQLILQAGTIADMDVAWDVARLELELHSVISTVVPAGNQGAIVCCRFKWRDSRGQLVVRGRTPNKFAASRPSCKGHGPWSFNYLHKRFT